MASDAVHRAGLKLVTEWRKDWNKFVREALDVRLDKEQQDILSSVQFNPRTAVSSGTARGKDFVAACAALSFLFLTPTWNEKRQLVGNTKVALTAPTDRQIRNIMMPEIVRLFGRAKANGINLPAKLLSTDIRTDEREWFLTGFKAGDDNTEAWSGFHAVNTMFVVTEATGLSEVVYNAIEGNLQGNSRLLLVFNPNITTGYAANAMTSERFAKFRLSSLNAENVRSKKLIIQGQVDYPWVQDKVESWCIPISDKDIDEGEGDFLWEGAWYRPNDLFRIKVLGMFPRVSEDTLIPYEWIQLANERWKEGTRSNEPARIGIDVAGMGRDSSTLCVRRGNRVDEIKQHLSHGQADHMHVVGMAVPYLKNRSNLAFVDTIGEGAGVYSRMDELGYTNAFSCKFSEGAHRLTDETGQYTFSNMKAYLFWAVRDWLNPKNKHNAQLPPDDKLAEELTNIKWKFQSNGSIILESKDELIKRIKRSPDKADALANTFYPKQDNSKAIRQLLDSVL